MAFDFKELDLKGAYLIDVFSSGDQRGGLSKIYEKDIYKSNGLQFELSETFVSISERNVVRGIHFQSEHPQTKLVSVLFGKAWDVIVDLRADSYTYGKWAAVELDSNKPQALYVPAGFGHGFAALTDNTIMCYQCEGKYYREYDSGIRFDDVDIGIKWPVMEKHAIHSERDLKLMSFIEYDRNPMNIELSAHGEG